MVCNLTFLIAGSLVGTAPRRGSEGRLPPTRSHPPEFVQRLKSRTVTLGESVRLSASVLASPNASITWEKDDLPLITDTDTSPYQTKVCIRQEFCDILNFNNLYQHYTERIMLYASELFIYYFPFGNRT